MSFNSMMDRYRGARTAMMLRSEGAGGQRWKPKMSYILTLFMTSVIIIQLNTIPADLTLPLVGGDAPAAGGSLALRVTACARPCSGVHASKDILGSEEGLRLLVNVVNAFVKETFQEKMDIIIPPSSSSSALLRRFDSRVRPLVTTISVDAARKGSRFARYRTFVSLGAGAFPVIENLGNLGLFIHSDECLGVKKDTDAPATLLWTYNEVAVSSQEAAPRCDELYAAAGAAGNSASASAEPAARRMGIAVLWPPRKVGGGKALYIKGLRNIFAISDVPGEFWRDLRLCFERRKSPVRVSTTSKR